jgi:hypothetical protein
MNSSENLGLVVQRREHGRFRDRRDEAGFHRCRRRNPQQMAVHAAFAKELARLQDSDHGFLPLLGYDDDLHPPFLDIEDRIRLVSLGKDDVSLAEFKDGLSFADVGEKLLRIKRWIGFACHADFWSPSPPTLVVPPEAAPMNRLDGKLRHSPHRCAI